MRRTRRQWVYRLRTRYARQSRRNSYGNSKSGYGARKTPADQGDIGHDTPKQHTPIGKNTQATHYSLGLHSTEATAARPTSQALRATLAT